MLYFSVFAGDQDAPRDIESFETWRSLGVAEEHHIFFLPKKEQLVGPGRAYRPLRPGYGDVYRYRQARVLRYL